MFVTFLVILANSAEPDEVQTYAALHLCLHCLSKCLLFLFVCIDILHPINNLSVI